MNFNTLRLLVTRPESGACSDRLKNRQHDLGGDVTCDGHLLLPLIASDSLHICKKKKKTSAYA
jgi:hypothetical protein